MNQVISRDGTPIAYHRLGSGPPLIILHGSGASNPTAWTGVMPELQVHFTIYAPDRRGYRVSGDALDYSLAHELHDLSAVIHVADEEPNLFGHSYGALIALEAARIIPSIQKLILYEPGISLPGSPLYPPGMLARLQVMLDAGDRDGVMTTVYRDVAQIPENELQQLKSSAAWSARLASAGSTVREARVEDTYQFHPDRFKNLRIPTLLLLGGDTTGPLKAATQALASTLPSSRVHILTEQQHLAMYTAPRIFTQALLNFLLEPALG